MLKISIGTHLQVTGPDARQQLLPQLLVVLATVHESGNLKEACGKIGVSYRHAWGMIREGRKLFGAPLVTMSRGRGATLTSLGERLLWADRRIAARLSPALDSLASEVEVELERALRDAKVVLRIHASHGFAVQTLRDYLAEQDIPIDLKYRDSAEALASLQKSSCDLAGFHVPVGEFQAAALEHYGRWLKPRAHRLIHLAKRKQGLMVAAGNPKHIRSARDLERSNVTFVNRQPGSGTRMLLDLLLKKERLDGRNIAGYNNGEFTHAAVAAYIASGMADVGLGVEPAARQFNLEFIPVATENYFFICDNETLRLPAVEQAVDIMNSEVFRARVSKLPGYDGAMSGTVLSINEAFPEVAKSTKRRSALVL
jgi:molybdate transport repressor ModE-like protein